MVEEEEPDIEQLPPFGDALMGLLVGVKALVN
jgi:hypothetical protein